MPLRVKSKVGPRPARALNAQHKGWRLRIALPPDGVETGGVSSLLEIEQAIEKLPPNQVIQLTAWLEDYLGMVAATAQVFETLDQEEGDQGSQWLGDRL